MMQLINHSVYAIYNNPGPMSEQGDSSSAEEVESPRTVVTATMVKKSSGVGGRWRRWRKRCVDNNKINNQKEKEKEKCYLHSQVLRVKEEELQIGEYLMGDFGIYNIKYVPDSLPLLVVGVDDQDDALCKITLPTSPLGSNKNY
ncbi:hypothetical protein SOVF_045390 [Spinacia oleracea]|nr:hypothetical protein SOVF_045390 [Spinacia oleracea]